MCFGGFDLKHIVTPPTPKAAIGFVSHPDVVLKNTVKEISHPSLSTPFKINPATNMTGLQIPPSN